MECEKIKACPFFNNKLKGKDAMIELLKKKYCLNDKTKCARYILNSKGLEVPLNLFPNDHKK